MRSHPTRPRAAERNISDLADIFLSVALRYKKGVHFAHPFMIAIINRYCNYSLTPPSATPPTIYLERAKYITSRGRTVMNRPQ